MACCGGGGRRSGVRRGIGCASGGGQLVHRGEPALMFIDDTDSISTGSFTQTQLGPQGPVQQTVGYSATVKTEHDTGFKLGAF